MKSILCFAQIFPWVELNLFFQCGDEDISARYKLIGICPGKKLWQQSGLTFPINIIAFSHDERLFSERRRPLLLLLFRSGERRLVCCRRYTRTRWGGVRTHQPTKAPIGSSSDIILLFRLHTERCSVLPSPTCPLWQQLLVRLLARKKRAEVLAGGKSRRTTMWDSIPVLYCVV